MLSPKVVNDAKNIALRLYQATTCGAMDPEEANEMFAHLSEAIQAGTLTEADCDAYHALIDVELGKGMKSREAAFFKVLAVLSGILLFLVLWF